MSEARDKPPSTTQAVITTVCAFLLEQSTQTQRPRESLFAAMSFNPVADTVTFDRHDRKTFDDIESGQNALHVSVGVDRGDTRHDELDALQWRITANRELRGQLVRDQ